MNFFEIRPSFSMERDRCVHPSVTYDDASFHNFYAWQVQWSLKFSVQDQCKIPMTFTSNWWHKESIKHDLSDWPKHQFLSPVCSDRMWDIISAYCPDLTWIRLSFGEPVLRKKDRNLVLPVSKLSWGILAGVVSVDKNQMTSIESVNFPALVRITDGPNTLVRYAVNDLLHQRLQEYSLIGVDFFKIQ